MILLMYSKSQKTLLKQLCWRLLGLFFLEIRFWQIFFASLECRH